MFHLDTQRRLTAMLIRQQGDVSIFEPACGLVLAALLIGGRIYAWGMPLGALLVNVRSNAKQALEIVSQMHVLLDRINE